MNASIALLKTSATRASVSHVPPATILQGKIQQPPVAVRRTHNVPTTASLQKIIVFFGGGGGGWGKGRGVLWIC